MTRTAEAESEATLRGLLRLLALERWLVAFAALAATLSAALALAPYFIVARMAVAVYAQPPVLEEVKRLAVLAVLALASRYALVAAANMLAHVAAFRILHRLRVRLAHKLGTLPLSTLARTSTADLKRTLMEDVNQIEGFVAHHFPDGVAALVVPISTALVLVAVDFRMALASIAVAPLAVGAMAIAMRDVGRAHERWNAIQTRMNGALLEYFRGIHVIKTFGLDARRFGDLRRSIEEGVAWMEGFMRTNGRGYGVFGALIGSSLVVIVPAGSWLYLGGSLPLDSFVLFLVLGPQLLSSLLRLMFAWGNIERIRAGNGRIQALLDAADFRDVPGGGPTPWHDGVSFHRVAFRYDAEGRDVLRDVTFEAEPGRITALVGPSGAGKTTLLRLVARLYEASSGAVELGGIDVRALPFDRLSSLVSTVFQDVFLVHGTVRENLRLGCADATDVELEAACRAARAHDFISALPQGYDTLIGERGARLSGGERQRLSIARALLRDAPVLLLDEATSFADPESEARIQDALGVLCRKRTVIVVAHRLVTVVGAHQIILLDAGRVVARGTHVELLQSSELYRELWQAQDEARAWSLVGVKSNAELPAQVAE